MTEVSGDLEITLAGLDTQGINALLGVSTHDIGITHRRRTGHWNNIDDAMCGLALIYVPFIMNTKVLLGYYGCRNETY